MRLALAVLAVAGMLAAQDLRGGHPTGADLLWERAQAASPEDLAHPYYLDAARELGRIRPWQEGYGDARTRLRAIAEARRAALR